MSLRLRLNLLVTALSLAFMLATGFAIVSDVKTSIRERVEAAYRRQRQMCIRDSSRYRAVAR